MTFRRAALLVGALPLLALAGCGGEPAEVGVASVTGERGSAGATATPSPSGSSDPYKFAQCMREHGIDMEDPDSSGRIKITYKGGDRKKMEEAQRACGKYLQGGGIGKGRPDAKAQDQLLKFVRCMREQGIDMEDPKTDGGALMIVKPKGVSPEKMEQAQKACEHLMPGGGPDRSRVPGS
ncbi:hypothetical protein HNP84_004968 [Thermocatellispora tengchongensis]|uniref:Uncharacterized protein n=1 Tax=Thermocatellispora tengchongensis TaxID=1073253 RepID=A0A840P7E6_9ACTN|nr:hypothetical protein [Thermocatellispora tengchongensis]MBB5135232.1 hypothetical protein [Thermocatellispora tengchongensis]